MQPLRILADDLTGALDTAGCFMADGQTLPLIFEAGAIPRTGSCALSTETRDVSEDEALARLSAFETAFDGFDGLAFKKIDSLLRGHVAAEIAHVVRQNRFDAGETSTADYTLLNASVIYLLPAGRLNYQLFVRGDNLANAEARVATSFLKDLAPLPGRGVSAGLRLRF